MLARLALQPGHPGAADCTRHVSDQKTAQPRTPFRSGDDAGPPRGARLRAKRSGEASPKL